jgi:thiol-disulfide isomerase/thioredoxin
MKLTRSRTALIAIGAVVVAAAIAVFAGSRGSSSSSSTTTATLHETGTPTVSGTALADYTGQDPDPAVGKIAPVATGTNFTGDAVTIGETGSPQLIAFVAHWCPHCQAEVPRLLQWMNDGSLKSDTSIVTVATATTSTRPNYPPSAWLAREHWTRPVLVDSADLTVAKAYGLQAFPFFVAVNKQGKVVGRASGELQLAEVQALLAAAAK